MASRKKSTPRRSSSGKKHDDPATLYARDVVERRIVAGPHVRDACARHLRDLTEQKKRGLVWNPEAAGWVFEYFAQVLRLNGGEFEGAPFLLEGWQLFVVGSLMGWRDLDGYRRFRVAYIETGKGSGKSPLVAGIGLYGLTADGEARAEVYAAAVKQDQAKVLFRDAIAMVQQSPALSERLAISGGQDPHNIAHEASGSFFRPISSEERGRGQSGPRPHIALLDEVHEHPTNAMVEFLRAGTKSRRQALILMITNSGANRRSPCFEYHEYAAKVCRGDIEDDGMFGYVCALDEDDDPFEDESCWVKANPSLPVVPGFKYLREQVREAKGLPSKESIVRRLNFCQWVDAENPLFARDVWLAVLHDMSLDAYATRRCWAAIDLSGKADLTAMAIAFEAPDGALDVFVEYWTPRDTLDERESRDRAPYARWVREGFLVGTAGKSVDYAWVAKRISDVNHQFELQALAFDRYRIEDLEREMDDAGLEHRRPDDKHGVGLLMLPHGQGMKDMAPAIDELEERVLNGRIRIHRNPVTTMCASNAVVDSDPAGNRKFNKAKATGRIDGMVAIAMVVRIATMQDNTPSNIYDEVELA